MESHYMSKKKIHKRTGRSVGVFNNLNYEAVCKVHNKTYSYKTAHLWKDVDCEKCWSEKFRTTPRIG